MKLGGGPGGGGQKIGPDPKISSGNGFFLMLRNSSFTCMAAHLALFSRKLGFSVLLKTRFYLHGSSFFNNSYFLVNFLILKGFLEIVVLPAWELHSGEVSPHISRFFLYFKRS